WGTSMEPDLLPVGPDRRGCVVGRRVVEFREEHCGPSGRTVPRDARSVQVLPLCASRSSSEIQLCTSGFGTLLVMRRVLVARRVHVGPEHLRRSPVKVVMCVGSP